MNYLILTPDGVGSTLLQRIITMCLYLESHEVTNTHELTNGLYLHNGIVKKNFDLKYSQSLKEIQDILEQSANQTQIVSRLAKYHINGRTDTKLDQNNFYSFLRKHFNKIIMCVRNNVFEYAMSWSIRKESDVLNVYNKADKDKVSKVSKVDESFFIDKCKDYVNYQYWVEDNFPNVLQVSYEDMLLKTDEIIKSLTGYDNTFERSFDIPLTKIMQKEYDFFKSFTTDKKQDLTKEEAKALAKYRFTSKEMIEKNIIFNVPLKNTTLTDKRSQIQNFDFCLEKFYDFAKNHNWIDQSIATYDFWRKEHVC